MPAIYSAGYLGAVSRIFLPLPGATSLVEPPPPMTTQVPNEGSDLAVYNVGHRLKGWRNVLEAYDMDIKNSPEEYGRTVGVPDFDLAPVEKSRDFLMHSGVDYEFRTTVVKGLHTKESLLGAARWIAGAKEYYLQQFKDSGDVIAIDGLGPYNEREMRELCEAVREFVPAARVRGV